MRISRVKLTGFKSFVDPVELRILPGLTGVVGPNGCGKSNLLEAIRWAMGEGSPKSLRGSAMDDVIFAGTASRPQRQFAEVSILAERADDELEVVRRIERGAGSAYRINGRDARARDAQLIFADAATGAHSPALVSQGKIGAVIAAKPADRRQMLEEAAGISGLHVRRKEAEIRLKATETNLARVGEQIADMETRATILRRQAKSAERYRKLTEEIRVAEGRLIYIRWREAAAAADQAKEEAAAADQAVRAADEAQRAAAAWSREASETLAGLRLAAQQARDTAADARHALTSAQAERDALDKRITALAEAREQVAIDQARESELARDAGEALTRLAEEGRMLDERIARNEAARPDRVAALDSAERDSRVADVALAQALTEQAKADAERRIAAAALASAASVRERAARDSARLADELAQLPDLTSVQSALDAARVARGEAEAAAARAVETLDEAEQARTRAAATIDSAEAALAGARAALSALESEARALQPRNIGDVGNSALALCTAQPGYEAALAAALADDLGAPVGAGEHERRWGGSALQPDDPALAAGPALADYVTAPPELARRLSQIAVVDDDGGEVLAVGQRLVTRNGQVRRWDGFVATSDGSAATETLRQRNRLAEVERLLPDARTATALAEQALTNARADLAAASAAVQAARTARDAADAGLRTALREEDNSAIAALRTTQRHAEISERQDQALADLATAQQAEATAQSALDALPADSGDSAIPALERAASAARAAVTRLQGELSALDAMLDADRARARAAADEADSWRNRSGKAGKRSEEMANRLKQLEEEASALVDAPARLAERVGQLAVEANDKAKLADEAVAAERAGEALLREREAELSRVAEAMATAREARAGAQARAENQELRRIEMGRVSGERFECPPPVLPEKLGFDSATVHHAGDESARLERLTNDRERIGPVNLVAEAELAEIDAGREQIEAEHAELTEATHRLRGTIGSLNREGRERLRAAFDAVDGHFRRLFTTLFNGGEAHLALIDSDDPLEAGLEIMAQPPGKKLTSLTLLSGGEQALTAVALIFALFLTNPAPLCVLDEVDAPLDDANVERFCDLLDSMTRSTDTRYLIVTHNAVTMARMHRLYGVTMVEQGISRLVSVDLTGAEELLAAE